MICTLLTRILPGNLDCLGSPAAPWGQIALALTLAASAALALRAGRAGVSRGARLAVPVLFSLAALMLAIALERPVLRQAPEQTAAGGHVVVLIDRSESFWRNTASARAAVSQVADRIDGFVVELPPQDTDAWRGEVFGFGLAAGREGAETSLANLPGALRGYQPNVPEAASNLRAGLTAALGRLADLPGRRLVVLLTDGQTADPPDADLLAQFRAAGIEIHSLAAGATAPSAGLIAADVGPEHHLGQPVVLRGTVLGGGTLIFAAVDGQESPQPVPEADHLRAFRLETTFRQRGLQGVALRFDTYAGQQGRALFTLVRGPARVLVFGRAPWAAALPAARWRIERADPLSPPDPANYDLVVVDALSPKDFPTDYTARLLAAADGTGLFVINGPLRGTVDQEQVISDWNGSVLNPILPVDSDPRLFVQEPPPRDIVIMVDVSGSMGGVRLGSAKSAINAIIDQLRPQDSVTILPFADGAVRSFPQAAASAATVAAARRFTVELSASGGTAPDSTIQESARFASNYCAFFFISDADFAPPATAPRCFTTAISVSNSRFPMNIASWGEELLIGEGGDGRNIRLRYFEPDEREEYFRPGSFRPLVAGDDLLLDAGLDVQGLAIAYARVDARIGLVHSNPPPDPLFVWRRDARRSGVATGAFLGPMGAEWGGQGLAATERMLGMLLGWSDQDRYLIRLIDSAGAYRLNVTELHAQSAPGMLSASLLGPDGAAQSLPLQFDPRLGAHTGTFRLPGFAGGKRFLLVLQQGNDVQRIPITVPADASAYAGGNEAFDFGVNRALIEEIIVATEGNDLEQNAIGFYSLEEVVRVTPIHPVFVAIAFLSLAAAVWSREIGRR
jgi:von Willebrand factor type A domain